LERGTCFGARRLAGIFFDDSILFSTISACLFSSLVAIGLLVVQISPSRLPPPRPACANARRTKVRRGRKSCLRLYSYVHRRLLYRDVGKNLLHARNTEGRSSDTSRTTAKTKDKQRQAKTSKTKTNKGKGTRKKSTELKTNNNQEITQARTQFPHTRSKTITNTKDLDRSSTFQNTIKCCLRW
jgi:hypothetical protein